MLLFYRERGMETNCRCADRASDWVGGGVIESRKISLEKVTLNYEGKGILCYA